jgi:rRNA processing protein Gar1
MFVFDDGNRKLGKIIELIGPVRAPYASVAVVSSKLGRLKDPVFVEGR